MSRVDHDVGDIASADRERIADLSLHEHLGIRFSNPEIGEVIGTNMWIEVSRHDLGVFCRYSERDECSHVPKDSMDEVLRDLSHELVGNSESESVFASFGEDLRERLGCEVLELIDIEEKWNSCIFIRASATHGSLVYLGHEHRTQESHDLFLEASFWELDEEDFLIIHDLSEVELVL